MHLGIQLHLDRGPDIHLACKTQPVDLPELYFDIHLGVRSSKDGWSALSLQFLQYILPLGEIRRYDPERL